MNFMGTAMICGIIVGILLTRLLLVLTRTDKSKKCRFDERQELIRGKGFKYGFFTMLVCNMLFVCMELAEIPLFAELGVLIIIGSVTGISVWLVYCIWNEGYFALNEDKGRMRSLFAAAAILNFIVGGSSIVHGTIIQNGKLTYYSINLFVGLLFIIIFMTMFLKRICKDGKDEQE